MFTHVANKSDLDSMFDVVAQALYDEDVSLRQAFGQAPTTPAISEQRHGLGYWLFETTLVYVAFKAMLRAGYEVLWEYAYPDRALDHVDMLVMNAGEPSIAVEAKWWMSEAANAGISADAARLRRWPSHVRGFVLTFWRTLSINVPRDLDMARTFCSRERLAICHAASFPTDNGLPRESAPSAHHFVVAWLEVLR